MRCWAAQRRERCAASQRVQHAVEKGKDGVGQCQPLQQQAHELKQVVAAFHLEGEQGGRHGAPVTGQRRLA